MAVINYTTPGVYIEEVPSGARPIQAVGTSTAGFIGTAPNPMCERNKPIAVNNWAEFTRRFMSAEPELKANLDVALEKLKPFMEEKNRAQAALNPQRRAAQAADTACKHALDMVSQAKEAVRKVDSGASAAWKKPLENDVLETVHRTLKEVEQAQAADIAYKAALDKVIRALEEVEPPQPLDAAFKSVLDEVKQSILGENPDSVAVEPAQAAGAAYKAALEKVKQSLKEVQSKQNDANVKRSAAQDPDTLSTTAQNTKAACENALKGVKGDQPADTKAKAALVKVIAALQEVMQALKDVKQVRAADDAYKAELNKVIAALEKVKENQSEVISAGKATEKTYADTDLSNAVYGFFLNGGSRCWIVNVGEMSEENESGVKTRIKPPITGGASAERVGLDLLEEVDEVAIVAAPGYTDQTSYDAIRSHCDKLKDRVGILDGPPVLDDPAMNQLLGDGVESGDWKMPSASDRGQLTLYVPWIYINDPNPARTNGKGPARKLIPPSGHVAGVWARSDATRGVHKAPANEPLRGALDLAKQITHQEQGLLNSRGVNVIRQFRDEGIMVWGSRTLTRDDSWNYLNVRRLFNMIEESIVESTRWIVFEPNDRPLWQAIRRDVTAFLIGFWRDGALMGRTPEEAFYVKCDEETNPIDSIRQGRVVIEIGLAPVYPAEFVIFKISQYQTGSEVEVQSA